MWIAGEDLFPLMATLGVLAQAGVTLMALIGGWRLARTTRAVAIVLIGAWGVERLGSATGFPFGRYAYTQALQPQLAGVPVLIPLAWLMMLPPAWAAAEVILAGWQERLGMGYALVHAALAGLAFTAWDLYLDPQMVARGLWVWDNGHGGYFGIPWSNLIGWWLSATLLTLVVRPSQLPHPPLLLIYSLTWAFQAIGLGIFWRQPGPALVGLAGMGMCVLWAWSQELRACKSSSGR
jgi:putative membrane protein